MGVSVMGVSLFVSVAVAVITGAVTVLVSWALVEVETET